VYFESYNILFLATKFEYSYFQIVNLAIVKFWQKNNATHLTGVDDQQKKLLTASIPHIFILKPIKQLDSKKKNYFNQDSRSLNYNLPLVPVSYLKIFLRQKRKGEKMSGKDIWLSGNCVMS